MNKELPNPQQIQDVMEQLKCLAKEALQTHGEIALLTAFAFFAKGLIQAIEVTEVLDGSQTLADATRELRSHAALLVCSEIMKAVT